MNKYVKFIAAAAVLLSASTSALKAEEGMWTFDNIPLKELKTKYNFSPDKSWLDNVRLSSVRFNDGGSGSFISEKGLVLTNHHVAVGQLQKMSSKGKNYVKDGFYAINQPEEVKCSDLELNILLDLKDVTSEVKKSFASLKGEEAIKARKAAIAKIEKENLDKTGMRSDVVSLYQGGEYWLYTYKKYRDVRLVFAPEKQIAFFGGSTDNFTYPRYDLDFAIFRVYENDKPVTCKNYMKINPEGAKPGELVFVSGHPGTTKREITYTQYLFNRDYIYPTNLENLSNSLKILYDYSKRGDEETRIAATTIFGLENAQKAYGGEYTGLKNPEFTAQFEKKEKDLREKINANPQIKKEVGTSFEDIEKALKLYKERFNEAIYGTINTGRRGAALPSIARSVVTYALEITKPDSERLEGYHDSQLDTWKYITLSPAPIYKDLEEVQLAGTFNNALKKLGKDHKIVKIMLDGKTPQTRAKELISGTKLNDVEYRKSLINGGLDAVKKSDDPLIKLALQLDPDAREFHKWMESKIEPLITPATEKIAAAKFKIYGKDVYPDATFTLRLAYGTVKGYEMNGTMAPPFTTFYGLYDRYYSFQKQNEWFLPESYIQHKDHINLSTPLNFVSDNDITGGNSGSPVISTKGEVVGLIFDGNIESLPGRFIFDDKSNRAVSVHTAGIIESLRKVYKTDKLIKELLGE